MPVNREFMPRMSAAPPSIEENAAGLFKLVAVVGVEGLAFVLHYAAYSQTFSMMPGAYLVDIPGIGFLFEAMPDVQVNHLIAAFVAIVSVATPVFAFYWLMVNRVIDDPRTFFAAIPNRVYGAAIGLFWLLMVLVEVVNVLTLLDLYVRNPFVRNEVADAIRGHTSLALLVAIVVAIANAALALATAAVWVRIVKPGRA